MNDSQFNALLKLLSDPDDFISESAKKKLIDEFDSVENRFNKIISAPINNSFIEKIKEIYREHYFIIAKNEFKNWEDPKNQDLLRGIFLINKIFSNELDYQSVFNFFESIKRKINTDLDNLTPIEQTRLLNAFIFKNIKTNIVYNQENISLLFLDNYFTTHKISPFLINVIYYIIAKKSGIPIYIIRDHDLLLLTYSPELKNKSFENNEINPRKNFHFFINPADKGYIFTFDELRYALQHKHKRKIDTFTLASNKDIIKLYIGKLIYAARKKNMLDLIDYLVIIHRILA